VPGTNIADLPAAEDAPQRARSDVVCPPELGCSYPLGATVSRGGVNFSLYSRDASGVDLPLFAYEDDARPKVITLDPFNNRTYHYWHVFVPGILAGQLYGYRVHGTFDPSQEMRFDSSKLLLDPYGRSVVVAKSYSREAAQSKADTVATAMKSVVVDPSSYDWEGDQPLHRPSSQSIIYEMHVRGFTRHFSSGVAAETRGTFRGLIEKIPYLQDLGISAIELLPVFHFDPHDCPKGLVNYWGYAPISFFAPHQAYSSRHDPLGPVTEFRDLVKAMHRAKIEVLLDVVFNHTGEGSGDGPTVCFRGIDNNAYYILEQGRSRYANYSGTGNTLNANHPVVRRMILDCLRYWCRGPHR
jgi:isoamylase